MKDQRAQRIGATGPSASKTDQDNIISESFAPLVAKHMHTLILGTMPGKKSLQLQQYYAHPRNALWPILCAIAASDRPSYSVHQRMSYAARFTLVGDAGFALWDVLARCDRPGSLDGDIIRQSEVANNVPALIGRHAELQTIVCNGQKALTLFKRHFPDQYDCTLPRIVCLPSTSPAMASLSLEQKHERWAAAITAR